MNEVLTATELPSGRTLQIVRGDLTEEQVDAIVNAANAHLKHGGGVAGAILRRGGVQIQAESDAWVKEHGPVAHGKPAYTRGGGLPARYVIHAVGPVWGEGDEESKLEQAVEGSLRLADSLALTSIAFPAISTGIFGFPKDLAAKIILKAILDYLIRNPESGLKLVKISLFDQPTVDAFMNAWQLQNLGGNQ